MTRVPRILFIAEAVSLAHVSRPLTLARWARAFGYDCLFACGNQHLFSGLLRPDGMPLKAIPTLNPQTFFGRLEQGKFFYTKDDLNRYLSHDRRLIASIRPDLIVSDFRLSMNLAAELEGVPLLALCNAHWNPQAPCSFDVPQTHFAAHLPKFIRRSLLGLLRPAVFRRFGSALDDLRRSNGLPAVGDFRRHYTTSGLDPRREQCAYLDHPAFSPPASLPPGHFFLGPILWQPPALSVSTIELPPTKAPLVYVTLGGSGKGDMLRKVLTALRYQDIRIVVSGLDETEAFKLLEGTPELKGRVRTGKLINPGMVLREARVTICHGGSGTVYQSLARGVPVLCLPDHPDQELVSRAVQSGGFGRALTVDKRDPQSIAQAYEQVTGKGTRARAADFSRVLQGWETCDYWEAYLETRLGRISVQRPNSFTSNLLRRLSTSPKEEISKLPQFESPEQTSALSVSL